MGIVFGRPNRPRLGWDDADDACCKVRAACRCQGVKYSTETGRMAIAGSPAEVGPACLRLLDVACVELLERDFGRDATEDAGDCPETD